MPVLTRYTTSLLLLSLFVSLDTRASEGATLGTWTYNKRAKTRPIARPVGLFEDRPQDFQEKVTYRGTSQRYTQLRYGSKNSRRVVIVVDYLGEKNYDTYADLDRDRILTSDECLQGSGRVWAFNLDTEIISEDQTEQASRRVELKLGITGKRMSVATVGFIEGMLPFVSEDGKEDYLHVRRVDGNANGLFADSRDRLLIDLDSNGDWNPITEQFALLPILKLNEGRFAVHSDRLGERLSLSEITGTGKLRVVVDALPGKAKMVAFEAMVFSDDGSAYSLKELGQSLEVPVGRYTLGSITMTINTGERDSWHFVFSRSDSVPDDEWTTVAANSDVGIEAVGKTEFSLGTKAEIRVQPGDDVRINPAMHTECGLLINLSSRGRLMGSFDRARFHNSCQLKLTTVEGKRVGITKSGFA